MERKLPAVFTWCQRRTRVKMAAKLHRPSPRGWGNLNANSFLRRVIRTTPTRVGRNLWMEPEHIIDMIGCKAEGVKAQ